MIERWWSAITCRISGRCDDRRASRDLIVEMNQRTRHIDAQASDIKRRRLCLDEQAETGDFAVDQIMGGFPNQKDRQ